MVKLARSTIRGGGHQQWPTSTTTQPCGSTSPPPPDRDVRTSARYRIIEVRLPASWAPSGVPYGRPARTRTTLYHLMTLVTTSAIAAKTPATTSAWSMAVPYALAEGVFAVTAIRAPWRTTVCDLPPANVEKEPTTKPTSPQIHTQRQRFIFDRSSSRRSNHLRRHLHTYRQCH